MSSEVQRNALELLAEIWALSPDVRMGQLFAHLGFLGEIHIGKGLGYIDDDEMIAVLCRHRAELLARAAGSASHPAALPGTAPIPAAPHPASSAP